MKKQNYIIVDGEMVKVDIYVIYAIKSGNLIKVGVTTNLDQRFKTINGYRMDAELIYNTDKILNGYEIETKIHNQLKDIQYSGEWYYGNKKEYIIDTIKSITEKYGKYASDYVLATDSQVKAYIKKNSDEFIEKMDKSFYDSAVNRIECLNKFMEEYLEKITGLLTIVKCYNGIIYLDPQLIHDAYCPINIYHEGWIVKYIWKYGYLYGVDYIIDDAIYISIGVAKELCSLINEDTIELRISLSNLERFILAHFPSLESLCNESKMRIPECDDVDAYLELATVEMNNSFENYKLTLDEYLNILGMELEDNERNNALLKLDKMSEVYKVKKNIKQNENGVNLYPVWLVQRVFDKFY